MLSMVALNRLERMLQNTLKYCSFAAWYKLTEKNDSVPQMVTGKQREKTVAQRPTL